MIGASMGGKIWLLLQEQYIPAQDGQGTGGRIWMGIAITGTSLPMAAKGIGGQIWGRKRKNGWQNS